MKDAATLLARIWLFVWWERVRLFIRRHRWELYVMAGIVGGALIQKAGYEHAGFVILALFALHAADHADKAAAIAGEG